MLSEADALALKGVPSSEETLLKNTAPDISTPVLEKPEDQSVSVIQSAVQSSSLKDSQNFSEKFYNSQNIQKLEQILKAYKGNFKK